MELKSIAFNQKCLEVKISFIYPNITNIMNTFMTIYNIECYTRKCEDDTRKFKAIYDWK